jgi:diaminobutyrate-2-oxoglutarate transaminase
MTLGSLAISGNTVKRDGAGLVLTHSLCMPYCGYFGEEVNTLDYVDRFLRDDGSGVDLPAAAVVETIQAEGGVNVADFEWLRGLEELCRKYNMLLILDEIQTGCGRTGPFFSFEPAGISPDLICLSKSISGYGLPMALTLMKPELDQWKPGEHNGTFRGNNMAFVTATEALSYWETDEFQRETERKGRKMRTFLEGLAAQYPETVAGVRGRGMIQGIQFQPEMLASEIAMEGFRRGLIVETSGSDSSVLKLLPALTIGDRELEAGFEIISEAVSHVMDEEMSSATR